MAFNNLSQKQINALIERGFTLKEIQQAQYNELYRQEYNNRPEVKQKRREYNARKYARTKLIREIAKEVAQ